MIDRPLLVLHDVGDAGGGRPWCDAFRGAGWVGTVMAPDLPGHAGAPAPEGGNHEPGDAAFFAVRVLDHAGLDLTDPAQRPVVLGVGVNGWNAQLHGLGGRAAAVVVVDGLGGPWTPIRELVLAGRDLLRAVAADPEALAPAPAGAALDPRLRHGLPAHASRALARRAAAAMPVPVVVVESPRSPVAAGEAVDLAAAMAAGGAFVPVDDPSPHAVATATIGALARFRPA